MKKILLMALFAILAVGCDKKEENTKETYPLGELSEFTNDDSLLTGQRLIAYPSSVKNDTYTKKDLENLDYNKEVRLGDVFFRIPDRCQLFKKEDTYFVDFPLDLSYKVLLSFKSMEDSSDLIDLSKKIIRDEELKDKIVSKPIKNSFTGLDSAYFITKEEEYSYTHFFIKSTNTTIYFVIKEDRPNLGGKIMADILMTAYTSGDDPYEVNKSFADYKDKLTVFATKEEKFADLGIKIPENFYLQQEGDGFKYYLARENNESIGAILMKEDRVDGNLYDAYNLNSGDLIYPTCLINMGKVSLDGGILEGEIRLYMKENTLTGKKFVTKRKNTYLTIIVVGPIANKSLAISMADSIKESIKK